jgi:G6PDH family F420-dependent oxidoreductase
MRELWQGEYTTIRGDWFEVDGARIYTLPEEPVELYVAAGAKNVAQLAGETGDGLIAVAPDEDVVEEFESAGGKGKPKIGMVHGCWAERREDALETALRVWPQSGLKGPLNQDLRLPADFMAAAEIVESKHIEDAMPLGSDPEPWQKEIQGFADAGFTHVYVHQIGPDQEGFLRWAAEHLL